MARIVDLSTRAAQLVDSYDNMMMRWKDVLEHWHDSQSERLEQEHLLPIGPKVRATVEALQRLDEFLLRAQRDCENYE